MPYGYGSANQSGTSSGRDTGSNYLNNTVCFAIAFALYSRVGRLNMFGVDFTYKGNLHFAEAGRACTEFWLAKCMEAQIQIGVSHRSTLLDHSVPIQERIYGFHRLKDPILAVPNEPEWIVCEQSKIEEEMERAGVQMPEEMRSPEPYRG